MNVRVRTSDLRVGMFVVLPGTWMSHSFFTSRFLIRNCTQLGKIVDAGFADVEVDPDRSLVSVSASVNDPPEAKPLVVLEPAHCFQDTDDSIVQIGESNLPSAEKASLIYEQSVEIVKDMFKKPTSNFIAGAKQVVGRIVDVILADPDTAENLLRVSAHNYYTYTHSVSVGVYGTTLAKHLYTDPSAHNLKELAAGFFLHDLGKVEVDPAIITKPGKLTNEEINVMRKHPYESFKILRKTKQLTEECRIVALQHHERVDGTGYPFGLKGDEIHEYARICAIADVFDALTSKRPYREPMSAFGALRMMSEEMPGHFDKEMLRSFILLFSESEKRFRAA